MSSRRCWPVDWHMPCRFITKNGYRQALLGTEAQFHVETIWYFVLYYNSRTMHRFSGYTFSSPLRLFSTQDESEVMDSLHNGRGNAGRIGYKEKLS